MRILDENRQEITEYNLTRGCLTPSTIIRPEATPIDNISKFAWADEDYEDVMIYTPYDWAREGREDSAQTPSVEETMLELMADHEYRLCMLELGGETL